MYHSESYHSHITTISTVVDVLSFFSTYILFFHWFTGFSLAIPRTLLIYIRSGKLLAVSRSVLPDSLWPHGLYPHQVPLSMGFSRQEYWNGLSFPSPGDFPDPGVEPGSPAFQANSITWATREASGRVYEQLLAPVFCGKGRVLWLLFSVFICCYFKQQKSIQVN